jgi:hypothetical protein
MRQSVYINTLKDMLTGSYYSSLTELDIPNRTPTFVEYRYLDEYESYPRTGFMGNMGNLDGLLPRPKHSKKFVDTHLNTLRDRIVVRDYGYPNDNLNGVSTRPETYYTNSYNEKRVSHSHYDSNKIVLKVYGDTEIVAGSVIELDILKVDNQLGTVTDTLRSGVYLIESIKNIFSEEMYYQELTVSASGVYAKPERSNEYVRERLPLSEFTERNTFLNDANGGRDVDGTRAAATETTSTTTPAQREKLFTSAAELENDPQFQAKLAEMQEKYGLEKEQLYKIIDGESSFNLTAQNASGATGLFQFIPSTAEGLGVTTDQILNMSAYEQLEVYDRYLAKSNYRGGDLGIIQAAPAYYGKPDDFEVYGRNTKAWEQNPPWRGPDGRITVGSINAYYNNR